MRPALEISIAYKSAALAKRCTEALMAIEDDLSQENVDDLNTLANELDDHLENCDETRAQWNVMASCLRVLACHAECRNSAKRNIQGLPEKQARLVVLIQIAKETLLALPQVSARTQFLAVFEGTAGAINTRELINSLLVLPLPTNYRMKTVNDFKGRFRAESKVPEPSPSVVKIIASLDGSPLVAPNLVKQNTAYTLEFRVSGENWPKMAERLDIDFLTTCPTDFYSISSFQFARPTALHQYTVGTKGQILFHASQSILAEPITFELRCAFVGNNGKILTVGTIGYSSMQFRVDDPRDTRLHSGYKHMDLHIANLLGDLVQRSPETRRELDDLVPVLEALASIVGGYAQDGEYKGIAQLSEAEFHKNVRKDLRIRLGNELQDHTNQAGGITDLRYRGVVIELKVEAILSDRKQLGQKYCGQLAQYEGTEARQIGVLLVLDLSPKVLPPGDIRNDIILVDVPTHGGADESKEHPSKAFLFIVNGNTTSPSRYSK